MSFDTRVDRLKRRLNRQTGPFFFQIVGDPEIRRLKDFGLLAPLAMGSDRTAMVGTAYFEAAPNEPTSAFHARMGKIALDLSARKGGLPIINVGHPDNIKPPRWAPTYPPPTPDGRRQRYDS
jgi:hypothetical protein